MEGVEVSLKDGPWHGDDGEYRTLEYVKGQCRLLAAQLKVYAVYYEQA